MQHVKMLQDLDEVRHTVTRNKSRTVLHESNG